MTKAQARNLFIGGTLLFTLIFLGLTYHTHTTISQRTHEDKLTPQVVEGKKVWQKYNCNDCHTILGIGGYYAPDMTKEGKLRDAAWLKAYIKDPQKIKPAYRVMPKLPVTDQELDNLVAFLQWTSDIDTNNWPPQPLVKVVVASKTGSPAHPGAALFKDKNCDSCHKLGGLGGDAGPALDKVAQKRDVKFLKAYLKDPAKVNPKTQMPNPELKPDELDNLVNYLLEQKS